MASDQSYFFGDHYNTTYV